MTALVPGQLPAAGLEPPAGALARCVLVDAGEFAARYWGRQPLLSPARTLPRNFTDLLTLDAVDELLARRGLRTPFLRMAKDGAVIDAARFTAPGGAGAEVADQVSAEKVLALFADGATVVLQGLHRTWPPVGELATTLAAELAHPVQVNAYVTPPQSRGFSAHYDVHDVFVLQAAGRKRWRIFPPVLEAPLRTQPWNGRASAVAAAAAGDPYLETILEPGDALYLPRGWLHAAEALGDVSVHLTVGVHPVTRYAVVEALAALVADDPELRRSLPVGVDGSDPASLAAELAVAREALVAALQRVPAESVAARLRTTVWPASLPEPVAPLASAAAAAALSADTVVRRRGALRATLQPAGDTVRLLLRDRTLTLPAATEPALRALLSGGPLRVGDLPGLDDADAVVLVRRLLREAVVVPAGP